MEVLYNYVNSLIEKSDSINNIQELYDFLNACDYCIDDKNKHGVEIKSNNIILFKNFVTKLLMSKIRNRYIEKKDKIHFTKFCKKHLISGISLEQLISKYPDSQRNIGSVPEIFLEKYKKEEKRAAAEQIFNVIAENTALINLNIYNNDILKHQQASINIFASKLSEVTKQNVSLSFVGNGFYGAGYKLTINNKNFFLKIFYPNQFEDDLQHGRNTEVQFAAYANKQRSKMFVKFFFGRICGKYNYDGFLVTEFLESDNLPDKNISLKTEYLFTHDSKKINFINNKIVDFGGLYEQVPELKDKLVRKAFRVLRRNINSKYNNNSYSTEWKISKKQANILKNYFKKPEYGTAYKTALNTLVKLIHNFPSELYDHLNNIKNWNDFEEFYIEDSLDFKNIITKDLDKLRESLKYYNIKMATKRDPIEGLDDNGYCIYNLNDQKLISCTYNKQNEITKIQFSRRYENQFITEIQIEDINCYTNFDEIYEFIKQ